MRKIITLMAIFLLTAGMSAAVDRHAPMKTGLFEVQIDDVEVKGWQSVTIPGKSIEQDEYQEGNDAEYEKKTWGQPTYDDITLERGVKPGATELHDWIKDIQAEKADSARKEIAVKIKDKESDEEYFVHATALIDEIRDDDEVTFELLAKNGDMPFIDTTTKTLKKGNRVS